MDSEMERKLGELLDRDAIWQVLQRYGRGLDRMDRALARSCYWDEAIEDHGGFVGPVDAFLDWADRATLSFVECHHGVMNHHCELDGDDAYAETYYLFNGVLAEPPHLLSMGRYVDHFRRRDGEWRILNRVAVVERNFELRDSSLFPGPEPAPDAQPTARDASDVSYQRPLRTRSPAAV